MACGRFKNLKNGTATIIKHESCGDPKWCKFNNDGDQSIGTCLEHFQEKWKRSSTRKANLNIELK